MASPRASLAARNARNRRLLAPRSWSLPDQLGQAVEAAAQARVDRPAREVEHPPDLAGGVLEQVAEDDHRPVLGRELSERRLELVPGADVLLGGRRRAGRVEHRLARLDLVPE